MKEGRIESLTTIHTTDKLYLLESSWCPDKDLLVFLSKHGATSRMTLYKMQGAKIWEVDVGPVDNAEHRVTAITWGPDGQFSCAFLTRFCARKPYFSCGLGQTIVIAHQPPHITFHSIQNGRETMAISLDSREPLTALYWFQKENKKSKVAYPDLMKRGEIVVSVTIPSRDFGYELWCRLQPGSAPSILKLLPLLDPLPSYQSSRQVDQIIVFFCQRAQ